VLSGSKNEKGSGVLRGITLLGWSFQHNLCKIIPHDQWNAWMSVETLADLPIGNEIPFASHQPPLPHLTIWT
jgi:hypothetical protein